ncbi:MAG: hypothetical protein ACE5OZ_11565 [Candidatus Heimdallarchaeota archaeon]
MSPPHQWYKLITPEQAELAETLHELLKNCPQIPKFTRSRGQLRFILARFIRLLNLQGPEDLWKFCDIRNYDKLVELDRADSSTERIYGNERLHWALQHVVKTLTAMRYLSEAELAENLTPNFKKLNLSFSQRLLCGFIVDEFRHRGKYRPKPPYESYRGMRASVGYFISRLSLQGPEGLKAFFEPDNYEKIVDLLATERTPKNKKRTLQDRKFLYHYIRETLLAPGNSPSELLRNVQLDPRQIWSDLLTISAESIPSHTIRLARIRARKLDPAIRTQLEQFYRNRQTRKNANLALRYILEYGDISCLSELSNYEHFERFYHNLRGSEGVSEKRIAVLFKLLSSFMKKVIKTGSSISGSVFRVNHARTVILRYGLTPRHERHVARDKDEIELWISTLPTAEEQALWALYAEGLRYSEPLVRSDPYDPNTMIGLEWSQFDERNRCLTNLRRKALVNRSKIHPVIRLGETTVSLLVEHQKANNEREFVFLLTQKQVSHNYKRHFKHLQRWFSKLKTDPTANPELVRRLHKLLNRENEKGKFVRVTPHQFRHTWNTLAVENRMQSEYRHYHMHHRPSEGDNVYIHISDRPKTYFAEYDRAAPKYQYDFSLAREVYPELYDEEKKVEPTSEPVEKAWENTTTTYISMRNGIYFWSEG